MFLGHAERQLKMFAAFTAVTLLSAAAADAQNGPLTGASPAQILQFCTPCHNDRLRTAGVTLEGLDLSAVGGPPRYWNECCAR